MWYDFMKNDYLEKNVHLVLSIFSHPTNIKYTQSKDFVLLTALFLV